MIVLVTGANGQLGQSLQFVAEKFPKIDFIFYNSSELDITNLDQIKKVFEVCKPIFCINAAAYTAVDNAESEPEKAFAINVTGSKNLAEVCKKNNTTLFHISTDFIFDGTSQTPYKETDIPNPTGVYGQTKLDGEKAIQAIWAKYIIIRTSWVYSQFGNNFMKTMLRLASERESLSVLDDQIGTPTNAVDLAEALVSIICHMELTQNPVEAQTVSSNFQLPTSNLFGIYNFSNLGQCSWYDFAKEIFKIHNVIIDLKPITTASFPTPAQRPKFSVLDKSKIIDIFQIDIKSWEESLKTVIFLL